MTAPDAARTLRAPDGAVIAYRLWRPGPPRPLLALLHGVASNMTRWTEFVTRTTLRQTWDLLRVDLRGNGLSLYRGRAGIAEWCADLAAILDAEGYPRAVVGGHCLGANVAMEFAARDPERVEGLVLVEPMLPRALTGAMRRTARLRPFLRPVAGLLRVLNSVGIHRRRLDRLDLEELDRQTRTTIVVGGPSRELLKKYASPLLDLRSTPSVAYLQALIAVSGKAPDLSAISVPVLALLASGQVFSDPGITETALAALPDVRIVRLDAEHWIPTEQPDAMRRAIEEWCTGLRARRPPSCLT